MNITIAAATETELNEIRQCAPANHILNYKVHGVGIMAAAFHLQKIAAEKPDLIIQCGIAGSFNPDINIGKTVLVEREMTDTGAEENSTFLTMFDLGLAQYNDFPFENGLLPCPFLKNMDFSLQKVSGLTVNCSSGTDETSEKRRNKFGADIETMEGAALHYVCLMLDIPFLQIRTISNMAEKRNKLNWNIPLALKNNAVELMRILEKI